MSLEVIENQIKKTFEGFGSGGMGNKSVHEHASQQLLYPHIMTDKGKRDENGEPILEREIDVDARTELPSPSGTTVLESYANYKDKVFGRGRGNGMRFVNGRYKINMISKDRKSRTEFEHIAVGASLSKDEGKSEIVQKVNQQ